jgi:Zn-dependent protease with chaperone function
MGQHPCATDECFGQEYWQKAIDHIADHNFPEEQYFGKVYSDRLNNAWTTDDNKVNISEDLLKELVYLGKPYLLSVSAHEIAHIRSHHYSRKASLSQFSSVGSPGAGPFSYRAKKHKAKLSRENELEADRLAVEYMINAGYEKKDYLNFLKWMKSNLKDAPPSDLATHPPIQKRITRVEQLNTLGFSKTNNTTLIKPQ